MGNLYNLDEFLLNTQVGSFSGTVPGIFRNADVENQEPSRHRSQNNPHPEVKFSACHTSNQTDSDPDKTSRRPYQLTQWNTGIPKTASKHGSCNHEERNSRKLERCIQIKNVRTFARLEVKSQIRTCLISAGHSISLALPKPPSSGPDSRPISFPTVARNYAVKVLQSFVIEKIEGP